ncbi:hypothetical protein [Cribrihabitans marinus]|uniref:hypothetical protein n=1 Tax=Cribrihabitans marinus TaxID=1227549 RepID=UPI00115F83FD|nr:hypothetical protein [Cribrihabitans marinus]GGH25285.1 hypothetical protein GCM10010973_12340 [Cribrihabitans marinus]
MLRVLVVYFFVLVASAGPYPVLAQQGEPASNSSTVTEALADKTIRFASDELGAGVQFFGSDGSTYLWFPGRLEIAEGRWSDRTFRLAMPTSPGSEPKIHTTGLVCFEFDGAPRGKLTGKPFGPNECFKLDDIQSAIQEVADGDVLDLKNGRAPCRLCRSDMPLSRLRNRLGS